MKTSKFFKFIIEGDELNLDETKSIRLPAKQLKKGEIATSLYTKIGKVQKTTRWVYSNEQIDNKSVSKFLLLNLKILVNHLEELKPFIDKYKTWAEIVLYAGNKTDICLSKAHINLLNKLMTKFYISFC